MTKNWFPKGTNYKNVVYHEFGHVLDNIYGINPLQILEKLTGVETDEKEAITVFLAKNLSKYAAKFSDGGEITSEVINMLHGSKPSSFALQYMKEYVKMMAEKGR